MTKSFVATVVLQLVAEGKLRLDDRLQQRLPGAVPGGEYITIRQLLNHTSGLADYTDDLLRPLVAKPTRQVYQQMAARRFTPQALVAMAARHRPLFPPGRGSPIATPTTSCSACWWSGSPATGWPASSSSASCGPWG